MQSYMSTGSLGTLLILFTTYHVVDAIYDLHCPDSHTILGSFHTISQQDNLTSYIAALGSKNEYSKR